MKTRKQAVVNYHDNFHKKFISNFLSIVTSVGRQSYTICICLFHTLRSFRMGWGLLGITLEVRDKGCRGQSAGARVRKGGQGGAIGMVEGPWVAPCHGNLHRGHDGAAVTPSSPDQVAAAVGPVESFCLRSTKARLLIWDRDREEGEQKVKARPHAPTWKTEDAVDCTRTTKMLRQCLFAIVQQPVYNVIALNCCAEQSQKQCP